MSYQYLTLSERAKIETLLALGFSVRAIAKQIKRSPSTVSHELKRHFNCSIEFAQKRYKVNKSNCGACTPKLKDAVQEKLRTTW